MLEYLQQLQDEVLKKDTVLLEGTEESRSWDLSIRRHTQGTMQTAGLSKRLKKNNWQDTKEILGLSWGVLILVKDMCMLGRTVWCTI